MCRPIRAGVGPGQRPRRVLAVPLVLLVGSLAGCGKSAGDDSGSDMDKKNSKQLTSGQVMILTQGETPRYGVIKEDGTYTVANVPTGPAKVVVTSPDPNQKSLVESRTGMAGKAGRPDKGGN